MLCESAAQADWHQHRALSEATMWASNPRKLLSLDTVRFSRPVIARIATVLLIGAAASPSVADNVGPARAVALPFDDIILPLPTMPPSNADPMNPASPGDVLT